MRCFYLLIFVSWHCYGQYNEFNTYSNGLIYDESTMNKLGSIVDSLNLKFRSCDLSHPYFAYPQGKASLVEIPNKTILRMIETGISFSTFVEKYPRNVKQRDVWIVKSRYENYEDKKLIRYSGLPQGRGGGPSVTVTDKKSNDKTTGWIVDDDGDRAFYIERLEDRELPFDYARLVQYVDCMIDTTAEVYFSSAKGEVYQQVDETSKAHQFISWAEKFPGKPKDPDYKIENQNIDSAYLAYNKSYERWDSLRILALDKKMDTAAYWNNVLSDAADEGLLTGNSDAMLEFYVSRYLSKDIALKLMRSRRVVGNCSQDQSPRYHAMNICKLAAETTQWDIFLRSHLDIMNDRFDRQSDGSYAWAGRMTYLKELEELDIPAIDLLLGTSLRVNNVSSNHYWGSIGRVGRALADASDKDQLEARLAAMIQDEKLDPYNRLLMAYLFDNYAYHLKDENRKALSKQILQDAVNAMPDYVKVAWEKE